MPYDFKKEKLYRAGDRPEIVTVPPANYIAVRGRGDPNTIDGAYQRALAVLYALAYTLKTSPRKGKAIPGFFDYVVPPLEGFWWQEGVDGADYGRKADFHWISILRLPAFVTEADFAWAVEGAARRKKLDCSAAELLTVEEGLCVQMLHTGPFETEPETVKVMDAFLAEHGYVNDFTDRRLHHEIYLSDARKTTPDRWRTILRHPVRKISS